MGYLYLTPVHDMYDFAVLIYAYAYVIKQPLLGYTS